MKRFVKVCVGSTALALGIAVAPLAAAAGAAANAATAGVQHGHLGKGRVVNFMAVSHAAKTPHPAIAPPALYFNPGAAAAQRAAAVRSGGRRSGLTPLAASRAAEAALPGQTWTGFATLSLSDQIGLFGNDQNLQPPDTQLAAGPRTLLAATNDTLSAWSKTGQLLAGADLNAFFGVPVGQTFTDPKLLYDTQSGRWFLSGWSLDTSLTNTKTYLAVSATSDPTGNWTVFPIASSSTGVLTDQPNLGVCDDKVVMSWNSFTSSGTTFTFNSADAEVLDKSALTGNTSAGITILSSPNEFTLMPAQSLSATTTCYMAVNNADATNLGGNSTTPALGLYAITGTNAASSVSFGTESELPIKATSLPPFPRQQSGTSNDSVIDDRLLSAVWQNGELWTSATDACTPINDSTTRDCMRLDEVSTGTSAVSVDTDLSQLGVDEYYPAVSLASTGDVFVSYSASSPTLNPGAYAVVSASATPTSFSAPVAVAAGAAPYNGGPTPRWGDYSAAAPDPAAPGAVWVAGEYAPSDANLGNWGTAAALISLSARPTPAVAIGAEGLDGQLWARAPQLGSGWHPLGGKIVGPPAVAAAATAFSSAAANPLFIGTGTDGTLWIRSATVGWKQVGAARCVGGAGAAVSGGTLTLACRGLNNALWYNTATMPSSGLPVFSNATWKSLGGVLSAGPAVAPVGTAVTFFVRGTNGQIFTRTATTGYAATPWICIGAPAAGVEVATNDTYFACQGGNHALWLSVNGGSLQNGSFGGWFPAQSLGGSLIGGPGIAAGSLVTDLLVEGGNKSVYELSSLGGGFTSLGGQVLGGVGAAALN